MWEVHCHSIGLDTMYQIKRKKRETEIEKEKQKVIHQPPS
jgi:hypothetical protein